MCMSLLHGSFKETYNLNAEYTELQILFFREVVENNKQISSECFEKI